MNRDYLFRRKRSRYWQLRLETPERRMLDGRIIHYSSTRMISTKCEKYEDALDSAMPLIIAHRRSLAMSRALSQQPKGIPTPGGLADPDFFFNLTIGPGVKTKAVWEHPVGEPIQLPDGGHLRVSKDGNSVAEFDQDGEFVRSFANKKLVGFEFDQTDREHQQTEEMLQRFSRSQRKIDDEIFENWASGGKGTRGKVQSRPIRSDARRILDKLHIVAPKKTLATVDAKDARGLIRMLIDNGGSTEGIRKPISHLKAMSNAVIAARAGGELDFPLIKSNVWAIMGLVPDGIPGKRAPPSLFSIAEEEAIFGDLPNWDQQCVLLWTFLYSTGARVEEPFQVTGEEEHRGHRCLRFGSKTPESEDRLIPIPPPLEALLPQRVTGPLFENCQDKVVFDMMERIRSIKVKGERIAPVGSGKTAASLRPRFVSIASGRGSDQDVIKTITGHVPDNFGANEDEANRNKRNKKGIWWRYMRGKHPRQLLDVMERTASLRGPDDL